MTGRSSYKSSYPVSCESGKGGVDNQKVQPFLPELGSASSPRAKSPLCRMLTEPSVAFTNNNNDDVADLTHKERRSQTFDNGGCSSNSGGDDGGSTDSCGSPAVARRKQHYLWKMEGEHSPRMEARRRNSTDVDDCQQLRNSSGQERTDSQDGVQHSHDETTHKSPLLASVSLPPRPSTPPVSPPSPRPPTSPRTHTFTRNVRNRNVRTSFDKTNKIFLEPKEGLGILNRTNKRDYAEPLKLRMTTGSHAYHSLGDISELITEEDEDEEGGGGVRMRETGRKKSMSTSCIPDILITF